MFESDDFDQILSQFEFPEDSSTSQSKTHKCNEGDNNKSTIKSPVVPEKYVSIDLCKMNTDPDENTDKLRSPKHSKRKIIDSYFDHNSKRKFPGPAGLLTGSFQDNKDEVVCHMELLSQDVDFSQNRLQKGVFDSPLWIRLLDDVKECKIDTIKAIKQHAVPGNLRRRKAHTVSAFIESIDRSITDPLISLRDSTGSIKCTLHRDAWSKFSPYIASDYCALVLRRPTILTTGGAFKKHYLNITLSNIYAIYSSAVINCEGTNIEIPDGFEKVYEEDFTVIKSEISPLIAELNQTTESVSEPTNLLDGLDSFFSDEVF